MKTLLPLVCAALLLSGCPDSKLPVSPPKLPPSVPEPKAEVIIQLPVLASLPREMVGSVIRNSISHGFVT